LKKSKNLIVCLQAEYFDILAFNQLMDASFKSFAGPTDTVIKRQFVAAIIFTRSTVLDPNTEFYHLDDYNTEIDANRYCRLHFIPAKLGDTTPYSAARHLTFKEFYTQKIQIVIAVFV